MREVAFLKGFEEVVVGEFDLKKFLVDVFQPSPDDKVTVMVDLPHGDLADNDVWKKRREMASRWRDGFVELADEVGFSVNDLVTYKATGANNGDLPQNCSMGGSEIVLDKVIGESTFVVAMNEYSATAPLFGAIGKYKHLRVASMPHCIKEMEETALAADYSKVADLCHKLEKILDPAKGATVRFSSGHECYFDLRFRDALSDDGQLPPDKKGIRLINLPSGEVCEVPYEGEKEGVSSKTKGELPVVVDGEIVVYKVDANRVTEILGDGKAAQEVRDCFEKDSAKRNIAEFGLGCNDKAIMRGIIIEDEKAAFHWAYGRSDHMRGIWGVDKFKGPETVIHKDILYPKGAPITVDSIELIYEDGSTRNIWDGEWYVV